MKSNWVTSAEAVSMISKNSHHQVSHSHLHTLVNRGKIGTRTFQKGSVLLKRSDVESTRVAAGIGNNNRKRERRH